MIAYSRTMELDDELAGAVQDRPHWRIDGRAAIYAPPDTTLTVRVQPMTQPTRSTRYVASVVRGDRAEYSRPTGTAIEAIRWAERVKLD